MRILLITDFLRHFGRLRWVLLLMLWGLPSVVAQEQPAANSEDKDVPDNEQLIYTGPLELPPIVRFDDLPKRMFLEPAFPLPEATWYIGEDYPLAFGRVLAGDYDRGLQVDAVYGLRRMHTEELTDVSPFVPDLQRLLNTADHRDLQRACAVTLAAIDARSASADLLKFCTPEWETVCLEVEPALARWQTAAAEPVWQERIENVSAYSAALVRLACQGLAALESRQSVPTLTTVLQTARNRYADRHAAAEALATLDADEARQLAGEYQTGDELQRLLAVALLTAAESDAAVDLLDSFCADPANAVASRAWQIMAEQRPEQLIDRVPDGRQHADANVRFVSVQIQRQFPSADHAAGLQDMLADIHIGVRNAARTALTALAESETELRDQILQQAGRALTDNGSNWQQLEQSLVLLAQQRHPAFQQDCVPLLRHERPEVFVSAAWLLHLMPRHELSPELVAITVDRREYTADRGHPLPLVKALNEQLAYLFHHAGLVREQQLYELVHKQFDKQTGLMFVARAAALWALGFLEEGNPDQKLISAYLERIFDDNPFVPEDDRVRLVSVLSITRMNGQSAIEELKRARTTYSPASEIGEAVRYGLPLLGGEELEPPVAGRFEVGGWTLSPLRQN